MTPASAPMGVVSVLRMDPADAVQSRRAALLQEVVAARAERRDLEARIASVDAKVAFLREQAEALLEAPALSAEEEERWLQGALGAAVRLDADVVAERSNRLRSPGSAPAAPDETMHEIAVLAAIEPEAGPPSALALVLPVHATVHTDWRTHGDDLQARLAWRVVGAVAEVLEASGAGDAPLRFDRFEDCLALQVWLGDHPTDPEVRGRLSAAFEALHSAAEELEDARLDLFLAWVEPSLLTRRPG